MLTTAAQTHVCFAASRALRAVLMFGVAAVLARACAGAATAALAQASRQCIARFVATWLLMASVVAAGSFGEIVDVATRSQARLAFQCARIGFLALEAFGHVDHIHERADVRRAIATCLLLGAQLGDRELLLLLLLS